MKTKQLFQMLDFFGVWQNPDKLRKHQNNDEASDPCLGLSSEDINLLNRKRELEHQKWLRATGQEMDHLEHNSGASQQPGLRTTGKPVDHDQRNSSIVRLQNRRKIH